MTRCVFISRAFLGRFSVELDPPVPGMKRRRTYAKFDGAAGAATMMAHYFGCQMFDRTGRLSVEECSELVAALADAANTIDATIAASVMTRSDA